MQMKTFFLAMLVTLVCTPIVYARQWTDTTGKHTVEAEFVEAKNGTVRLKKENGQIISLPLAKLSDEDKAFVRKETNGAGIALADRRADAADTDSDGDGLSDFQEIHKYCTNPNNKDTAGKGLSDDQWQQRREFSYSLRAVIRVMRPYNAETFNDDYQDVRILAENDKYAELEVIVYPLNSNAEAIAANPNWKKDDAGMTEYLAPGITTNWDEQMRKDLLSELANDGIKPDKLTDKAVVEQVSRWLFKHSQCRNMFCSYYIGFPDGKPVVLSGLEKAFERDKGDPKWTVQQQFDHELYGKSMFANKTNGTCTSTAILETTVLRALGIPTRMILCIPLADGSDPGQLEMVEKGLTNHRVRHDAFLGAMKGGSGFTSHTFCEVFVAGRWRRLNYTKLGQNVLDGNSLGLMIKVHTFNDLSEANLAETLGTRYANGLRDDVFKHSNPYCLLEVSDHFGTYASVSNPPTAMENDRPPEANWFSAGPAWKELEKVAAAHGCALNSFNHRASHYETIMSKSQPGSTLVLLFALDHWDTNIPEEYQDLLPMPWTQIEAALDKGETVERTGKARKRKIVLLAAPTESQLNNLINKTQLLSTNPPNK
jgi:hypothetical protein